MKNKMLIVFMLGLLCCDDILDTDLTSTVPIIRGPADKGIVASTSITFWWDTVPGATGYSLMIVSPDVNATQLVADTTISSTTFKIDLDSGKYGWCLKAVNTSYQSKEVCRSFQLTTP